MEELNVFDKLTAIATPAQLTKSFFRKVAANLIFI